MTPADLMMLRAFEEGEQLQSSPFARPDLSHDFPSRSHENNNTEMQTQWQKSSDAFISQATRPTPSRSTLHRNLNYQQFSPTTLSDVGQPEGDFRSLRRTSPLPQLSQGLFEPNSSRLLTPSPSSPASTAHLRPLFPSLLPSPFSPPSSSPSPSPSQEHFPPSPTSSVDTFQSSSSRAANLEQDWNFGQQKLQQSWQRTEPLRIKRKFPFRPAKRLPHHVDTASSPQWQVYAAVVDVGGSSSTGGSTSRHRHQANLSEPAALSDFPAHNFPDTPVELQDTNARKRRIVRFQDPETPRSAQHRDATQSFADRNETGDSLTSSFTLSKFSFPLPPRHSWQGTFGHLNEEPPHPPVSPAKLHYRGVSFDLVNPHTSLVFGSKEFESPGEIDGLLDHYFDKRMSSNPSSPENPPSRVLYDDPDSARRTIMGLGAGRERQFVPVEGEAGTPAYARASDPFDLSISDNETPIRRTYANMDEVVEDPYYQPIADDSSSSCSQPSDVEIILNRSETPEVYEDCRNPEQDFNNLESENTVTNLVAHYDHSEVSASDGNSYLLPEDSDHDDNHRGIYRPPSPWPLLAQPTANDPGALLNRVVTHEEAEEVSSSSTSVTESATTVSSSHPSYYNTGQIIPPNSPVSPVPESLRSRLNHAYQGILLDALISLGTWGDPYVLRVPPNLPPPDPPVLYAANEVQLPYFRQNGNDADTPSSETYGNTGQLLNLTEHNPPEMFTADGRPYMYTANGEPYVPLSSLMPHGDWTLYDDAFSQVSHESDIPEMDIGPPRFPSFGSSEDELESLPSASEDEGDYPVGPSPLVRMRTALSLSHGQSLNYGPNYGGLARSSSVYDFDAHADDASDWETQAATSQTDLHSPRAVTDRRGEGNEVRVSEDSIADTSTYDEDNGLSMIFDQEVRDRTAVFPESAIYDNTAEPRRAMSLHREDHGDQADVEKVIQLLKSKQRADEILLEDADLDPAFDQLRAESRDAVAELQEIRKKNPAAHAAGIAGFADTATVDDGLKSMSKLPMSAPAPKQQQLSKPSSLSKLKDLSKFREVVGKTRQRSQSASQRLLHRGKDTPSPAPSNGPSTKPSVSSMNTIHRAATVDEGSEVAAALPAPAGVRPSISARFQPAQISRQQNGRERIGFPSMVPVTATVATSTATATATPGFHTDSNDGTQGITRKPSGATPAHQAAPMTPRRAAMSSQTELRELHLAKKKPGTEMARIQQSQPTFNNTRSIRSGDHSLGTVTSPLTDRDLARAAPNWNMKPQFHIGGQASGIIPYPSLVQHQTFRYDRDTQQGPPHTTGRHHLDSAWLREDMIAHKDLSKRWFLRCLLFPPATLAYSLGAMDWIIRRASEGKFASFHPTYKQDAMTAFWAMCAVWFGVVALLFFLLLDH